MAENTDKTAEVKDSSNGVSSDKPVKKPATRKPRATAAKAADSKTPAEKPAARKPAAAKAPAAKASTPRKAAPRKAAAAKVAAPVAEETVVVAPKAEAPAVTAEARVEEATVIVTPEKPIETIEELAEVLGADLEEEEAEDDLPSVNEGDLPPGYWQGWVGDSGRINVFSWLGFIFTLAFFPLGLIFSAIGYMNAKQVSDDKFSKNLAAISFGISAFFSFLVIIPLILVILIGIVRLMLMPFMVF